MCTKSCVKSHKRFTEDYYCSAVRKKEAKLTHATSELLMAFNMQVSVKISFVALWVCFVTQAEYQSEMPINSKMCCVCPLKKKKLLNNLHEFDEMPVVGH